MIGGPNRKVNFPPLYLDQRSKKGGLSPSTNRVPRCQNSGVTSSLVPPLWKWSIPIGVEMVHRLKNGQGSLNVTEKKRARRVLKMIVFRISDMLCN